MNELAWPQKNSPTPTQPKSTPRNSTQHTSTARSPAQLHATAQLVSNQLLSSSQIKKSSPPLRPAHRGSAPWPEPIDKHPTTFGGGPRRAWPPSNVVWKVPRRKRWSERRGRQHPPALPHPNALSPTRKSNALSLARSLSPSLAVGPRRGAGVLTAGGERKRKR